MRVREAILPSNPESSEILKHFIISRFSKILLGQS